jgi:hypothetical protein
MKMMRRATTIAVEVPAMRAERLLSRLSNAWRWSRWASIDELDISPLIVESSADATVPG